MAGITVAEIAKRAGVSTATAIWSLSKTLGRPVVAGTTIAVKNAGLAVIAVAMDKNKNAN